MCACFSLIRQYWRNEKKKKSYNVHKRATWRFFNKPYMHTSVCYSYVPRHLTLLFFFFFFISTPAQRHDAMHTVWNVSWSTLSWFTLSYRLYRHRVCANISQVADSYVVHVCRSYQTLVTLKIFFYFFIPS